MFSSNHTLESSFTTFKYTLSNKLCYVVEFSLLSYNKWIFKDFQLNT